MKRIAFLIIASLLVIGLVLPGCGDGGGEPEDVIYTFTDGKIKVAIAGPMDYIQGEHMWQGAELANGEIGTVDIDGVTHTIQLIQVETKEIAQPYSGYSAGQVENAITVQGADFIIGGFRTEATAGMIEKAMQYKKMFFLNGAATGDLLKQVNNNYAKYKYLFRATPINETFLFINNIMMLGMVGPTIQSILETPDTTDVKVAVVAEDLLWTETPIATVAAYVGPTGLNYTLTEVYKVSDTADAINTELNDIKSDGVHIVFTILSGPVGVTYGKQMGELGVPAMTLGINVESQDPSFWDATAYGEGKHGAESMITLGTWAPNIAQSGNLTTDFLTAYVDEYGEFPVYTAASYDMLLGLVEAIEDTATYDAEAGVASVLADDLIAWFENPGNARVITSGTAGYFTTAHQGLVDAGVPAFAHDLKYGPQWVTGLGVQWQDDGAGNGIMVGVWPNKDYDAANNALNPFNTALGLDWTDFEHEGTEMFDIPTWMIGEW